MLRASSMVGFAGMQPEEIVRNPSETDDSPQVSQHSKDDGETGGGEPEADALDMSAWFSGFFWDLAARVNSNAIHCHGHGPAHKREIYNFRRVAEGDMWEISKLPSGLRARACLLREQLHSELMDGITSELKQMGESRNGFAAVGYPTLRKHAACVISYKRAVLCLAAEVDNWLMRYKLLHAHPREAPENLMERKSRLEEFWMMFHDRSRDPGPPQAPPGANRSGLLSPSSGTRSMSRLPRPKKGGSLLDADEFGCSTIARSWQLAQRGPGSPKAAVEAAPKKGARHSSKGSEKPAIAGGKWESNAGKKPPSFRDTTPSKETSSSLAKKRAGLGTSQSLPSLINMTKGLKGPSASTNKETGGPARSQLSKSDSDWNHLFVPPWSPNGPRTIVLPPLADMSRQKYFRECDKDGVVPTTLPFVTGHSAKLEAAGRDLSDRDLMAMAVMITEEEGIEHIDLQGNAMLSDRSLAPFLRRLRKESTVNTLEHLSLAWISRAGLDSLDATLQIIRAASKLRVLDLSGISIGMRFQLPLCQAIGKHDCLTSVVLAQTGLGQTRSPITLSCITELCSSDSIERLNLSWNCFHAEEYCHLGQCIAKNREIKVLSISGCSAAVIGATPSSDAPVGAFVEHLSRAGGLRRLDLSLSRASFRTALILEDSLDRNKNIVDIDLSSNPFGVLGIRSILRLLSRETSGLVSVETEGCYTGFSHAYGQPDDPPVYSAANPGGKYRLDLTRPYHRSVLRLLYKAAERFKVPTTDAFVDIEYSQPPWVHATKCKDGIWVVPTTGCVTLTFNIEKALEAELKDVTDSDHVGFLNKHFAFVKLVPGFRKVIPLIAAWKRLNGRLVEQDAFLQALSKDFILSLAQIEVLCKCSPSEAPKIVSSMLPSLPISEQMRYMGMRLLTNIGDFIRVQEALQTLVDFNLSNATGHYKLNLGSSAHFTVAQQLLLLDRWESGADRRCGRFDISQRGNRSHVRNETYQGRPLNLFFITIAEWCLPEASELEFDYVSSVRPPRGAESLSSQCFDSILVHIHASECPTSTKIAVLRNISHHFYVTSMQMRELLGMFRTAEERADTFVIFFMRVLDVQNSKSFTVRFEKPEELQALQERLGYAVFLPFIQPENRYFELILSRYDQRLCACVLVGLAAREKPSNIKAPMYILPDGKIDPLPLGVPRSWDSMDKIPKEGRFHFTYNCAPEDRKFAARKDLQFTYSYFTVTVPDEEVLWWTGLNEVPPDMIELLEFMIGTFPNANKAFKAIDGENGNGEITRKEFIEGLEELGCKKFQGKDEDARINAIFRYLDPGGEGSVSHDEWQIFAQLWREFQLTVHEFVCFLVRVFGPDLKDAWANLDDDGSGELTLEEWVNAITEYGYFGPTAVVFNLLDNSDDGNISIEEFMVLENYVARPATAPPRTLRP